MSIAVVIPTHGPTTYLAEAVASVAGADEVIVVEDGTAAADEATLGGARLLRLPRVGRSRARNTGVEAASTPFVAFLDADDVSLPGRLERQREALEAAPGAPLCFGRVRVVDGALAPVSEWNELLGRRFAQLAGGPVGVEAILDSRCPIYTSATMVRRHAFLDEGGYDPRFDAYEDLDLYLRLAARGFLAQVEGEPVTLYRLHGQNTDSDRLYAGALGVAEKHLPDARGAVRRLLLERRVDAFWGLGRFGAARRAALGALAAEPLLLGDPRFVKRLGGTFFPAPLLRARRRATASSAASGRSVDSTRPPASLLGGVGLGDGVRIALLKDIAAPYRIPLFNELARRPGLEFRLILASRNDPRRDYPFYAGEFGFEHRVLTGFELHRGLRWVVFNRGLRAELARFAPDVLVVGGWAQPVFWQGILWARRRGVPIVLWVESTARDARRGAGPLEVAKRLAVRAASGFLVPGRAAAEYVESFGVDPGRIEIAPNAVDLSIFSEQVTQCHERRAELRAARGLGGCVFVCVSRLSPEKGVDVLVRAFEGVTGTLVAIGDGPQDAELRASAPANVHLVGRVERDELPQWYAAADAFVMPSRSETWGMAMNEAAAAGLPIVATEAPGAAYELIEEGVNGFRVPVGDEDALREALTRVAENPAWREAARARTLELAGGFTAEAWADALERLVQRLPTPSV